MHVLALSVNSPSVHFSSTVKRLAVTGIYRGSALETGTLID
jgi:hypothetical protein